MEGIGKGIFDKRVTSGIDLSLRNGGGCTSALIFVLQSPTTVPARSCRDSELSMETITTSSVRVVLYALP